MKYNVKTGLKNTKAKVTALTAGLVSLAFPAAIALSGGAAAAAVSSNYTLFGDASVVSGGNPGQAVQTESADSGSGGIDFSVPSDLTVNDLTTLSTDFMATQGGCAGGSPRFQVNVSTSDGPKNLFVYLGNSSDYTCNLNTWTSSGNLLTESGTVDATQLGGTFYEPYSQVLADYGTDAVTGIQLVTDGGWKLGTQTALFDNTQINGTTYTYDQPQVKDTCKSGGWENLTDGNGQAFKNQGQCVSWVEHNVLGHGTPAANRP